MLEEEEDPRVGDVTGSGMRGRDGDGVQAIRLTQIYRCDVMVFCLVSR